MPFVEFREKGGRGKFGFPALTLLRSGGFNLNRAAYEAIGRPPRVVLAYDSDERRIGVRAAQTSDDEYAYPVREVSRDSYWVASQGFLKYHGIENKKTTLRYRGEKEDEYLAVDLKVEPVHREKRSSERSEEVGGET